MNAAHCHLIICSLSIGLGSVRVICWCLMMKLFGPFRLRPTMNGKQCRIVIWQENNSSLGLSCLFKECFRSFFLWCFKTIISNVDHGNWQGKYLYRAISCFGHFIVFSIHTHDYFNHILWSSSYNCTQIQLMFWYLQNWIKRYFSLLTFLFFIIELN